MHDVSLGTVIQDYLTGESLEATTYEDLRQAMARLLVEEKGYPRPRLKPRVAVSFPVEQGRLYTRLVDLVAFAEQERPLLALIFCPGIVTTYTREALAAARLLPGGAAALVVITDSKEAVVLETGQGELLGSGLAAIPDWRRLQVLAAQHQAPELDAERKDRERRILYAYSESLYACCGGAACAIAAKGGRFGAGEQEPGEGEA